MHAFCYQQDSLNEALRAELARLQGAAADALQQQGAVSGALPAIAPPASGRRLPFGGGASRSLALPPLPPSLGDFAALAAARKSGNGGGAASPVDPLAALETSGAASGPSGAGLGAGSGSGLGSGLGPRQRGGSGGGSAAAGRAGSPALGKGLLGLGKGLPVGGGGGSRSGGSGSGIGSKDGGPSNAARDLGAQVRTA